MDGEEDRESCTCLKEDEPETASEKTDIKSSIDSSKLV